MALLMYYQPSLAHDLVRPFNQRHEIRRSDETGILAHEVGVADRTGP